MARWHHRLIMLRFHTPLIEPDRRISRIRLSDKACSILIFPHRRERRLVHVAVVIASGTSKPLVEFIGSRQSPGFPSRPQMGLELRPLPSTGVTRRQQYYGPLRHPRRPGLSLAGVRLRVTRPHRLGFPVLRWISVYRHAVVITPVARWVGSLVRRPIPAVYIARQRLRPSPRCCRVGVHIGRFEACSTFTRVTACLLAASPKRYICLEGSDGFVTSP